jgi:L-ascorbate metabolism protein UlaG (beta-lactamase superfamily)
MQITFSQSKEHDKMPVGIRFIHIRHSTSVIEIGKVKILIDPMLSDKESLPPVLLTGNKLNNPRKSLPFSLDNIINDLDYLLLTHLHFDHFDKKAIDIIPKTKSIFCSPTDSKKLHSIGFLQTHSIEGPYEIDGITIKRYPAVHGKGLLKYLMGKGSSYSIDYNGFKLFLTGDCILTKTLITNLVKVSPHLVIANAGAARFKFGKPITMSIKDVQEISKVLKDSKIVVVHLDALNHCTESRDYCKEQIQDYSNIFIPDDGEIIYASKDVDD